MLQAISNTSPYGRGWLVLVKHDKHAEPDRTKYLFTNALNLTNREFVLRYRSRWTIECFFRTCRQTFGLGACQAQMMSQVLLHVRMVFLASTMMQLLRTDSACSLEQMQTNLRSLNCLVLPKKLPQLVWQQENGGGLPVTLEALLLPLRTRIQTFKELTIPSLQEIMCSA